MKSLSSRKTQSTSIHMGSYVLSLWFHMGQSPNKFWIELKKDGVQCPIAQVVHMCDEK